MITEQSGFHKTTIPTLDDGHIGRNMYCDIMLKILKFEQLLKTFIDNRVARKMIKPLSFASKWCATGCYNIIL
jgi:hypothetical protein